MNESSLPIAITGMSEMIRRVTRMNVTVRFNLCTKHSYIHVQMNHVTHMNGLAVKKFGHPAGMKKIQLKKVKRNKPKITKI